MAGCPVEQKYGRQVEILHTSPIGDIYALGGNSSDELENEVFIQTHPHNLFDVLPLAGANPPRTFNAYSQILQKLGLDVEHIYREECRDEDTLGKMRKAHYLFLTGGNQQLILENFTRDMLKELMHDYKNNKIDIITVSAGTAVLGDKGLYSSGGLPDDEVKVDRRAHASAICKLKSSQGERTDSLIETYGIVQDTIWDTHMNKVVNGQHRIDRLKAAVEYSVERQQFKVGIGVDEDTLCVCRGGKYFEVRGKGEVSVVVPAWNVRGNNEVVVLKYGHGQNFSLEEVQRLEIGQVWVGGGHF